MLLAVDMARLPTTVGEDKQTLRAHAVNHTATLAVKYRLGIKEGVLSLARRLVGGK